MSIGYNPAKKGSSRTWLIRGGARADHEPEFMPCWRPGAVGWPGGDVSKIECPSPDSYNKWDEIGNIQGGDERPTTDVQGRYAVDRESVMLLLRRQRCAFDLQFHLGECTNPKSFNEFSKAQIWEDAIFTDYSTDELGALASGDNAEVNETAPLSAKEFYEVLALAFAEKAADIVANPVLDVVICSTPSCGDCADEDGGCDVVYAIDDGASGSPGTEPDLLYSVDKGQTFAAENISSMAPGDTPSAVFCLGEYVVVTNNTADALDYKEKANIGGVVTLWTETVLGFVAAGSPNDGWSVGDYAFIVGDAGYIYGTSDPTTGVTVLDAGVVTTNNLAAVHALDRHFAVAVGAADTVLLTTNGEEWVEMTATGGGNGLLCVWIKSRLEWWVGDDAGNLYYTLDGGVTWTERVLPGANWTAINDIQFPKKSVGYLAADKSGTPKGFILETFNGGENWTLLPQGSATFPANDSIVAIATCPYDPNFVVSVGTADNGTDGIILVGQD